MQTIKCVVVGDDTVGKTSMILTYATNSFPSSEPPMVSAHLFFIFKALSHKYTRCDDAAMHVFLDAMNQRD